MKIKIIKKRKAPEMAEPAALAEGALTAEKARQVTPAPDSGAARPAPPLSEQAQARGPNPYMRRDSNSKWFEEMLEKNPHKKAQYEEAQKRPIGDRATICTTCGHPYILPCINDQDRATCMNAKFIRDRAAQGG